MVAKWNDGCALISGFFASQTCKGYKCRTDHKVIFASPTVTDHPPLSEIVAKWGLLAHMKSVCQMC